MDEKTNNKKKIAGLIAVIAVIAIVGGVAAGVVIGKRIKAQRDYAAEQKFKASQEALLGEELDKILAMDPLEDEIDESIYAEKDYAKVEQSMKAYFTDFFALLKKVNAFSTDERFAILMNPDQMFADAPNFTSTLTAIDTLKNEYAENIDGISVLMTSEKIDSYLDADLAQEYVDIYDEMMTSGSTVIAETEMQEELNTSKEQMVSMLDKYKTMVDYLVSTQGSWQLEGTTFMFTDQGTLDQYNAYVADLQNAIEMLKKD
ncbi:MAG: hypothetical protein PHW34_11340 [Hespellia sp.]|nr:hypothetical protein [Hespellia sp.]